MKTIRSNLKFAYGVSVAAAALMISTSPAASAGSDGLLGNTTQIVGNTLDTTTSKLDTTLSNTTGSLTALTSRVSTIGTNTINKVNTVQGNTFDRAEATVNATGTKGSNLLGTVGNMGDTATGAITAAEAGLGGIVSPGQEGNLILASTIEKTAEVQDTASIDLSGDNLVEFSVDDETVKALGVSEVDGAIEATNVPLTPVAASSIVSESVNLDGVGEAKNANVASDGSIVLSGAGKSARVDSGLHADVAVE